MGCTLAGKLERLQKRTARIVLREGASNDPVLQLSVHLHFQAFARIRWHRPFFFMVQRVSYSYKTRSSELNVVLPAVWTEFRKNNYVPGSKDLQ